MGEWGEQDEHRTLKIDGGGGKHHSGREDTEGSRRKILIG
jgi:hypothetical protein